MPRIPRIERRNWPRGQPIGGMPEPISSQPPAASSYDPTLDEAGAVCRDDSGAVPAPPSAATPAPLSAGAQLLVNQHRTTGQVGVAPYADVGITSSGVGFCAEN